MKSFLHFLFRSFAAASTSVFVWLISFLAFDQTFLFSLLVGFLSGSAIYLFLKWLNSSQLLRENGLSRREYQYIKKNLKEAKLKIHRLQKALFRVRSLTNMKQNFEMLRVVNKIYMITKKEPKRFYQAERFYFTNLDSIVELTEKYALLHAQPAKTAELTHSLNETRIMMNKLNNSLEKDLYTILEDDIDHLQFELDVAKKQISKNPIEKDNRGR
ncbi:5-bromo-4-chloroindolyl phosphate hydrolysis family protein [Bacillus sp. V3B]|uniref:5-bromo-4-chloroindolyl phosphate hydrolysis family protein n=1 Tax=Bacillus sp. V3B TaxID=2804915 RepID=UPI00210B68D5|nr:5-bromo-4-chloroindolyl phosphate hydrolysis family protein [Bacillus sp. V3B]MCQ6276261.1 5-bromo-4-chloroindolyl phosphate hydrolysis family protein [Bacillus sp. V3B]